MSGERIADSEAFAKKADENLVEALSGSGAFPGNSAFGLQDRIIFFKKKWLREHKSYIALWVALWNIALGVTIYIRQSIAWAGLALFGLFIYGYVRNRMMIYVEQNAFSRLSPN